jgi:hypothetical protein
MNDIGGYAYPDWEGICLSIMMTFLTGALWPWLFIGICLKRTIGSCNPETFIRRVGGESREQKMKRKRKELRSHQETVERLENELNIEC